MVRRWGWLLAAACAGDPATPADDTDTVASEVDPREPGPYHVGWRTEPLTYTTIDGRSRSLTLQIFYPTEATTGGEVVFRDGFPTPLPELLGDAPPADGVFPVLVHSHGHIATGGAAQPLGVWLGSHGWVVVAPDHTPDTFANILADDATHTPPELAVDRPADLSAALDAAAGWSGAHPLAGHVDAAQAVVSGHSRGTSTVWSVLGATYDADALGETCPGCAQPLLDALTASMDDPRFVGGIGMAGSLRRSVHGDDGELGVAEPFLSMSGSADQVGADTQFASVVGVDLTWVELAGGCHESFASGIPCPGLDTELGFRIVGTYALAFARHTLLGEDGPLVTGVLDGSLAVDAAATVHTQAE